MLFPIVILSIIGLSGLIALWLSITFVAFDIYKSGQNLDSSISLAKLSKTLQYILLVWFIALGVVFMNTDTGSLYPFAAYALFMIGFTYLIYKMYGNILSPIRRISIDDGSKKSSQLINKSLARYQSDESEKRAEKDYENVKKFFWTSNVIISAGVLINFWMNDTEGVSVLEVVLGSVGLVLILQIFFMPIYFISKKVISLL